MQMDTEVFNDRFVNALGLDAPVFYASFSDCLSKLHKLAAIYGHEQEPSSIQEHLSDAWFYLRIAMLEMTK